MLIAQSFSRGWLGLLLMSLLSWSLCTGGFAEAYAQPQEKGDKGADIKTLLKERHALLEQYLKLRLAQFEIGTGDFLAVAKALTDCLKSSLDVVEGPEKRAAELQQYQKIAEKLVYIMEG